MPIGRIQLKHGLESSADFNTMLQAEAYYATDTERLMISNGDGTGLILPSKNEIDTKIGDLTSLTTTEKGSIVGAVNEIDNNLNLVELNLMPVSGSSGTIYWTKFPDGTMVVWGQATITNTTTSYVDVTLPVSFTSRLSMQVDANANAQVSSSVFVSYILEPSETSVNSIRIKALTVQNGGVVGAVSSNTIVRFKVIGFWK